MGAYARFLNWLSTTPVGTWLVKHVFTHLDPAVYRMSGGRFTAAGPLSIPQLVLTTTGRKSGRQRSVQLACLADDDDFLVVASNMGQAHHPGWSYNLDANDRAVVNVDGRDIPMTARRLSDDEKETMWPRLAALVPQFDVYVTRTDRNIKVYRLAPRTDG